MSTSATVTGEAAVTPPDVTATPPVAPPPDANAAGTVVTPPADGQPPAGDAPAEWAPVVPEGYELEEGVLEELKGFAEKHGHEAANAVIARQHAADQKALEAYESMKAAKVAEWRAELAADPVIGGAKFEENLRAGERFLVKYGGPEFAAYAKASGLESQPGFVRMLVAAGKDLAEDSVAGTTAAGSGRADNGFRALYTKSPNLK